MIVNSIKTIDELIEFCKSVPMFSLVYYNAENNRKFAALDSDLLINILQTMQVIQQSQVEVKVDQEKIDEIIEGSLQPLE